MANRDGALLASVAMVDVDEGAEVGRFESSGKGLGRIVVLE